MLTVNLFSHKALLFYDTFLTVGREVRLIWSRRHAATTGLYIIGRYSIILSHLIMFVTITKWSGKNAWVSVDDSF